MTVIQLILKLVKPSLSSRRAWIEIEKVKCVVATKELSLSSRRAWIEISVLLFLGTVCHVALLAESVD